jgi:Mg-chelatase subunit ChlD
MNKKILAIGIFAATAATVTLYPQLHSIGATSGHVVQTTDPLVGQILNERPKIEVVFVLDTTGSMGGLIQAAKEKIWSIASTMASAQPAPEIKMGLVAYRDRGDAYVTQVVDLSGDLDSMYARLMDFQADGGGDGPESVNQALHDAVHNISWSQDPDAYQVVFLVGDAPPHMDYQDDVKYPDTLAIARARGIVVNTIQCGQAPETTRQWHRVASLADGQYFQVEQAGSAIAIATPFDEELARLSAELDDTRLYYGDRQAKEKASRKLEATDKLHALASFASRARRAAFNASAAGEDNFVGENELIDALSSGRVDLDEIDTEHLPEPMQAMAPAEQRAMVEETAARRTDLQQRIGELSKKRDGYLKDEVTEAGNAEASLDHKIYGAVKAQAEAKGLHLEDAPKY